ncbi:helix-turn-helix domain-containing protein [Chloroflexota bacterium]
MATDDSEKLVLTVEEARQQLRLSRGSMYEAVRCGQIPSIRVGRRILIPRAALQRLFEEPKSL